MESIFDTAYHAYYFLLNNTYLPRATHNIVFDYKDVCLWRGIMHHAAS